MYQGQFFELLGKMTVGLRKTLAQLLEALVNETSTNIEWNESQTLMTATIPDVNHSTVYHTITAQCRINPFSGEVQNVQWETILLDGSPLKETGDLAIIGLTDAQQSILKQNIEATDCLEDIYEQCRVSSPKAMAVITTLLDRKSPVLFDACKPQAYALLLAQLSPREALLITETCGNVDGSTGNPIKNVMFGAKAGAINHHPIVVAFQDGLSQLQLVSYPDAERLEAGCIPERLKKDFKFYTDEHQIPMNKYAVAVADKEASVQGSIDAFVLLSKRSFMPINGDYQIKTSFPAQITSENRTIDWTTAEDAIECAQIVARLAELNKLPDHLWVLPTFFAAQVKDDDNTTFYIRGGLRDAYGNGVSRGVPKHLTPIIACALTTRNLVTPDKTLFESLIEYGFDPIALFRDISDQIIAAQLHFIAIRWVPDAHTQNIAYLLDMNEKRFAGLLLKDSECEKNKIIRGGKLATNIFNPPVERPSENKRKQRIIISTLYFHHTIYTKHIEPLVQLLHEKYQVSIVDLQKMVHHSLTSWLATHPEADMENKIDLTGRYYERNLACKTLKIGNPPYYRLIKHHKLLPNV